MLDHDVVLSKMFAALADPTRRAIVDLLTRGEATVNELAEPFDLSQQAVSHHIKVLETAGLVSRSQAGTTRPCRLEPGRLGAASAWIEQQQALWADRHDRLEEHLRTVSDRGGRRGGDGA